MSGVAIPWPLHLVGGGARPEDSLLISPQGADCGLAIASTAKVANLSFRSTLAPCVVHERGCLRIERCLLRCDARGLDHLVAPLLTRAMSGKVRSLVGGTPSQRFDNTCIMPASSQQQASTKPAQTAWYMLPELLADEALLLWQVGCLAGLAARLLTRFCAVSAAPSCSRSAGEDCGSCPTP